MLFVLNFNTKPYHVPVNSIWCELVFVITGTRVRGSIVKRVQSRYNKPTVKGRNQLHIKVLGQHIRGSPFLVDVKSPLGKIDTLIQCGRS